ERGGDERRLLNLGVDEILHRPLEAQLLEVEPGGSAAGVVDGHRLRYGLGDVAAHTGLERPLAREHEGDPCHAVAPVVLCVHSISAEPHVGPAPIPVISTSFPGWRRPSSAASASASGMEPDEVLP